MSYNINHNNNIYMEIFTQHIINLNISIKSIFHYYDNYCNNNCQCMLLRERSLLSLYLSSFSAPTKIFNQFSSHLKKIKLK